MMPASMAPIINPATTAAVTSTSTAPIEKLGLSNTVKEICEPADKEVDQAGLEYNQQDSNITFCSYILI